MHRKMNIVALLFSGALPCQNTWIVDASDRPGAHFTDLPPAVESAAPGDTLVVRVGLYSSTTVSKGLQIVAAPVPPYSSKSGFEVRESMTISGLGPGQKCTIRGLFPVTVPRFQLNIWENAGPVYVDSFSNRSFGSAGVSIRDCAQVTLNWCSIDWVWAKSSGVLISESMIGVRRDPMAGIDVCEARIVIASSSVVASGRMLGVGCQVTTSPLPALRAVDSDILVTGPSAIIGGQAIRRGCEGVQVDGVSGRRGSIVLGSLARVDGIAGSIRVIRQDYPHIGAHNAMGLGVVSLTLWGPANAASVILTSVAQPGPSQPLGASPGWPGIWVGSIFAAVHAATLPATGRASIEYPLPGALPPSWVGLPVAFQALTLSSLGVVDVSTASVVRQTDGNYPRVRPWLG